MAATQIPASLIVFLETLSMFSAVLFDSFLSFILG